MALELTRRRFSVDDYYRMAETGILKPGERVELIDGDVVEMTPSGGPHARCVMYLNEVFVRRLEGRAVVSPQISLRLGRWSVPEPDIALLRPPLARYGKAIPSNADALLVVEVADREPSSEGYQQQRRYERGAEVAPAAFPDVVLDVADILG